MEGRVKVLGKKRVAIIDDDGSVRTGLSRQLRSRGISVTAFGSAQEFLADGNVNDWDCLMVDLRMPGLTGFDLIEELDRRQVRVPLIIMTAFVTPAAREEVRRKRAICLLEKPFLGVAIDRCLRLAFAAA